MHACVGGYVYHHTSSSSPLPLPPVVSLTPPPLASVFQEFVRKYQSSLEQTAVPGRSILPKPSPPSPHAPTAGGSPREDPPPAPATQEDIFNPEGLVQSLFPALSHSSTNGNGSHCASIPGRAVSRAETHASIPVVGKDIAQATDKPPPATGLSTAAVTSSSTTAAKMPPKQR